MLHFPTPFRARRSHLRSAARRLALLSLAVGVGSLASAQDRTVLFDVGATGVSKSIPQWGLDTAWPSPDNMRRGVAFMGADQVDLVRVSFPVNAALVNGELATAQLDALVDRLNIAALAGAGKPLSMTPDTEAGVDAWYKNGAQVIPDRWVQAMEATQRALKARGKTLVSAAPFNEPDYGWNQGTVTNLYDILGLLQASSEFTGVAFAGPSTLSCDAANTWYEPIKSRVSEGTTHQLSGSFASYAGFYQNVVASGDRAVNEELHNVCEAIVGAEYGLQTGIWWGTAEFTRASFVKACQGMRLAYAEHRPNWTAAAVYRAPGGAVQAFVGASERQAVTTSYRFVSKDRDVFYDGHGPRRDFTVTIPGGNGYWVDQPNAEKLVNIGWGADVQPAIDGRYFVVNRNSAKAMEVASTDTGDAVNIRQNNYLGTANQQWDVAPLDSRGGGDYSYFTIKAVHSGKAADLNNWSHDDGANIQQWTAAAGANQSWFLEYAGDGWFHVRNRWSGKYLDVQGASTAPGANVCQWSARPGLSQQWRLIPVGAALEFTAPAAPTGLAASAGAVSVRLSWNAGAEPDLAGYTVLRADTSGGPYSIVARGLASPAFTDKSAHQARAYHYVVQAADRSLNRSASSAQVSVTPTGAAALVAHHAFDGDTLDASGNANHAEFGGTSGYGAARVGSGALALDGATRHVNLAADVAASDRLTVAAWIYWNGGASWQRIFDFGNDTNQYLFLTPAASGAGLRFAIKNGGAEQVLNAPALATGQWVHVAVTLGASDARLYVNGADVASSAAITIRPSDIKPVLNYLGKSQWPDPLFNGRIDDFRIYNHALAASDVATLVAGAPAAPGNVTASPGPEQIQLTWGAVPNAASYTVKVATNVGGPYATLAAGLTAPSYTHANLGFGQVYYYLVEATNLAGTGAASAPINATPQSALITATERDTVRITVAVGPDGSSVATVVVPASVAGHAYQLQYTADLNSAWTDIETPLAGNGGELTRIYPSQPAASPAFYRVLVQR